MASRKASASQLLKQVGTARKSPFSVRVGKCWKGMASSGNHAPLVPRSEVGILWSLANLAAVVQSGVCILKWLGKSKEE